MSILLPQWHVSRLLCFIFFACGEAKLEDWTQRWTVEASFASSKCIMLGLRGTRNLAKLHTAPVRVSVVILWTLHLPHPDHIAWILGHYLVPGRHCEWQKTTSYSRTVSLLGGVVTNEVLRIYMYWVFKSSLCFFEHHCSNVMDRCT